MIRKLSLAAVAACALSAPANADTLPSLTHDISLFGTSSALAQGLTFLTAQPFSSTFEHGALTALGDGGSITWRNQGSPNTSLTVGSNLSCGGSCLVTGSNNGLQFSINVLSVDKYWLFADNSYVAFVGTALASLTGFAPTEGTFSLSLPIAGGPFGFTWIDPPPPLTLAVVATPIPGALPLFGSGLFALWMTARRKRKRHSV